MDPNATLELWRTSRTQGERAEYRGYLRDWLKRGGFEPAWTPGERRVITWGLVRVVTPTMAYWAPAEVPR